MQVNPGLFSFVFVLLLFIQTSSQVASCSWNDINTAIQTSNTFYSTIDTTATAESLLAKSEEISSFSRQCLQTMLTHVDFSLARLNFTTDQCPGVANYPESALDPCCNPQLTGESCCRAKSISSLRNVVKSVKSSLNNICKNPNKVQDLLSVYVTKVHQRSEMCETLLKRKNLERMELTQSPRVCLRRLFDNPTPCSKDSDCVGGFCDWRNNQCVYPIAGRSHALVDCMMKSMTQQTIGALKIYLGLPVNSPQEAVRIEFNNRITQNQCFDRNGAVNSNYMIEMTCTAAGAGEICTHNGYNTATCPVNTPACFATSFDERLGAPILNLTTQNDCNNSSYCMGQGWRKESMNQGWGPGECAQQSHCTFAGQCNENTPGGCTRNKCLNQPGKCVGWPNYQPDGICVLTKGSANCESDQFTKWTPLGCWIHGIDNTGACGVAPFADSKWIPKPSNEAECTAIKGCFDATKKTWNSFSQSECVACNAESSKYEWKQALEWVNPRWEASFIVGGEQWMNITKASKHVWRRAIHQPTFDEVMSGLVSQMRVTTARDFWKCHTGRVMDFAKKLACDCGSDRPNGIDCFKENSVEIGAFSAYSGSLDPQTSIDMSIIPLDGAFTAEKTDVLISTAFPPSSPKVSGSDMKISSLMQSTINSYIGSSGIRISCSTTCGKMNLCLKKDPMVVVIGYTSVKFATFTTTGVQIMSVPVAESSTQVCGQVDADPNISYVIVYEGGTLQTSFAVRIGIQVALFLLAILIHV